MIGAVAAPAQHLCSEPGDTSAGRQICAQARKSSAGIQCRQGHEPMKNTTATVLALLALLLTACSASPSPEPSAGSPSSPSTGLAASLPKPNAAQQEALLASLAKISPGLSNEQSVDKARSLCGRLLGLASEDQLIAAAKTAFTGGGVQAVSDGEAQRIISVIGANGFCR